MGHPADIRISGFALKNSYKVLNNNKTEFKKNLCQREALCWLQSVSVCGSVMGLLSQRSDPPLVPLHTLYFYDVPTGPWERQQGSVGFSR